MKKIIFIIIFIINLVFINTLFANSVEFINSNKKNLIDKLPNEKVIEILNKKYVDINKENNYLDTIEYYIDYCIGLDNFLKFIIEKLKEKENINNITKLEIVEQFIKTTNKTFLENIPNLWEANSICQTYNLKEEKNKKNDTLRMLLILSINEDVSKENNEMSYLINLVK